MKGVIVVFMAFVAACTGKPHLYYLDTGEEVWCREFQESWCGVYLGKCNSDREYFCQTNLSEQKPMTLDTLMIHPKTKKDSI